MIALVTSAAALSQLVKIANVSTIRQSLCLVEWSTVEDYHKSGSRYFRWFWKCIFNNSNPQSLLCYDNLPIKEKGLLVNYLSIYSQFIGSTFTWLSTLQYNIHIAASVISVIISTFEPHKACELDCIPAIFLRKCISELPLLISKLFNKSLTASCFSARLKSSSVIPNFRNWASYLILPDIDLIVF